MCLCASLTVSAYFFTVSFQVYPSVFFSISEPENAKRTLIPQFCLRHQHVYSTGWFGLMNQLKDETANLCHTHLGITGSGYTRTCQKGCGGSCGTCATGMTCGTTGQCAATTFSCASLPVASPLSPPLSYYPHYLLCPIFVSALSLMPQLSHKKGSRPNKNGSLFGGEGVNKRGDSGFFTAVLSGFGSPFLPASLPFEIQNRDSKRHAHTAPPPSLPIFSSNFSSPQNGYYADPTSCAQYHICSNSLDTLQTCTTGLLWNSAIKACDWPVNVVCGGSAPCAPQCSGKQCGDDGCGGPCLPPPPSPPPEPPYLTSSFGILQPKQDVRGIP